MFELKKITNAGCNIPEFVSLPFADGADVIKGCALVLKDGTLVHAKTGETPTHISATNGISQKSGEILSYKITSEMVFDVPVKGDFNFPSDERYAVVSDGKHAVCIEKNDRGNAVIVGISDTGRKNKVSIQFNI